MLAVLRIEPRSCGRPRRSDLYISSSCAHRSDRGDSVESPSEPPRRPSRSRSRAEKHGTRKRRYRRSGVSAETLCRVRCAEGSELPSLFVLQIAIKPVDSSLHGVNLILALREAMPFVGIVVCVHDRAFLFQNRFRLLRLFFGVSNVVRSL